MAKYHFLTGDDLLAMSLTDRIARCVEIKAEVVAADEREDGRRALLNYGHTLAHALEIATDYRSRTARRLHRPDLRRPPGRVLGRIDDAGSTSTTRSSGAATSSTPTLPAGLDADAPDRR